MKNLYFVCFSNDHNWNHKHVLYSNCYEKAFNSVNGHFLHMNLLIMTVKTVVYSNVSGCLGLGWRVQICKLAGVWKMWTLKKKFHIDGLGRVESCCQATETWEGDFVQPMK